MNLPIAEFLAFCGEAVAHYEKSAPAVADYVDDLFIRINSKPETVLLVELTAVSALRESGEWEHPNYAANRLYKLANRLGRDTTGLAGF
jgi:hypothetical protein